MQKGVTDVHDFSSDTKNKTSAEVMAVRGVAVEPAATASSLSSLSSSTKESSSSVTIPDSHPRAHSLHIRHTLVKGFDDGLVAAEGLLAHGRGEAFDYLLGEHTGKSALHACKAAAATLCKAKNPVISVNGNAAALCAEQMTQLAAEIGATLEINLFYDSDDRREAIARQLRRCGADNVMGLNRSKMRALHGTDSARRMADVDGIMAADVVLVSLEDGDRTSALKQAGKTVIAIDLNPLSRTSQTADIAIIDNITRTMDILIKKCKHFRTKIKNSEKDDTQTKNNDAALDFDNQENLKRAILQIKSNLETYTSQKSDDIKHNSNMNINIGDA